MTDTPSNSIYSCTSLGDLLKEEANLERMIGAWEAEELQTARSLRLTRARIAECRLFIRQRLKNHQVRLDTLEWKEPAG